MSKNKLKFLKKRILNILFWSVVSAAFIGPGTVTTATKAGADFQFELMWALVFSTFACLLLQEASARATIYSGMNLGEAISKHFEGKSSKMIILFLVVGAIIIGCAAYETGNILGSVEGLSLVFPKIPKSVFLLIIGVFAMFALSFKSIKTIARFMGSIVFFMGVAFFTTAVFSNPPVGEVLKGSLIPTIPETTGAGLLILGLIGTTVVPYDLFLGSGVIDKEQTIKEMRFGLSVAVILGGIISMAIMVVGTEMTRGLTDSALKELQFSYKLLEQTLVLHIGQWAVYIFGFGMFAAGFSSAITAPLASAITAQSIFQKKEKGKRFFETKPWKYFKVVSFGVLIIGLTFGFLQVKPIPAIIMAQALNGLILPFISIFLIFVVNNKELMGKTRLNSWISNIFMSIIVWTTIIIGSLNVIKAISKSLNFQINSPDLLFTVVAVLSLIITLLVLYRIYKQRINYKQENLK